MTIADLPLVGYEPFYAQTNEALHLLQDSRANLNLLNVYTLLLRRKQAKPKASPARGPLLLFLNTHRGQLEPPKKKIPMQKDSALPPLSAWEAKGHSGPPYTVFHKDKVPLRPHPKFLPRLFLIFI